MPRFKPLFAVLLILTPILCVAQTRKEDWPEGSAVRAMMDASEHLQALDKKLQAKSQTLVDLVEKEHIGVDLRLQRAIAEHADAWRIFRSSECSLAGAIVGGGGAWPIAHGIDCEVSLTISRIKIVDSTVECVEHISIERRSYDGFECFQQLQVLAGMQ